MENELGPRVADTSKTTFQAVIVETAGRERNLFRTYTTGNGHCAFSGPQILTTLANLDAWVRTGVKPVKANFPAALGFDNTFEPPPMNYP